MTLRVIGYIRVSTKGQDKNGYGLGAQHDSLRQFCEQRGYELLTVTSDVVSGADSTRMYGRGVAIAAIETGVADALPVRALDRATRSQLDHASLFERAQRHAWRLMDCDGADSGDASQRLTADVRNTVAAEERRKISERTRECLAKARRQGTRLGRPPQIEPDSAPARRIVRMSTRNGLSPNKIAQRLTERGVPSPGGDAKWYATTVTDVFKRASTKGKRVCASGTTTYVVRWYAPDGTERSKGGFRTRKDAKAFAVKADAQTLTGIDFDPGKGKMLFRDAAAIWLESRKADTRNNAENHRYALAPAATRRGDGKTLGIDAVFGDYPLNKITREYIQAWTNQLTDAGKKPSTVRHAFWTVRMVLEQALVDGRLAKNPAEHVKLPKETGTKGGKVGEVVDRAMFLTSAQVSALVAATPWPYNVLVHVAAWAGLRVAEIGGLTIANVELPDPSLNPNVQACSG